MAFNSARRSGSPSFPGRNNGRSSGNSSSRSNSHSGSLSSRFSSMAAERIATSTRRPHPVPGRAVNSSSSTAAVRKNTGSRHQRSSMMEIDQVGNNYKGGRGKGRRDNKHVSSNSSKPSRSGNNKKSSKRGTGEKKASLTQTDLDKDLESYMMKNQSTARNTLDMDLDSYMAAAPSKSN